MGASVKQGQSSFGPNDGRQWLTKGGGRRVSRNLVPRCIKRVGDINCADWRSEDSIFKKQCKTHKPLTYWADGFIPRMAGSQAWHLVFGLSTKFVFAHSLRCYLGLCHPRESLVVAA